MELALWILKFVIGPIVAVIVTLLITDPLKTRLAPLVLRFGSKKQVGVGGRWVATFYFGENETPFVEVIEMSKLLGFVVGRIVPHKLNVGNAKAIQHAKPIRVRGTIKDNRFFTGIWLHPERHSHHHGAFDLVIRQSNVLMEGMWLGYSESRNRVVVGRWEWRRLTVAEGE